MALMQVKVMFFGCDFEAGLVGFNTFRTRSPSNFGSHQFTVFLCQRLGVNIEPYFSNMQIPFDLKFP